MNLNKFNLDCNACTKEQKEDRGCISNSPIPGRWQLGDDKFQRCPIRWVKPEIYWYIKAYNFMEKGILPRIGGWLDQSSKFINAMNFINKELEDGKKQLSNKSTLK